MPAKEMIEDPLELEPLERHAPPPADNLPAELRDPRQLDGRRPCRVLIVDDDDFIRARLAALLKVSHYDIEVAASGEEALRIMSATHFHIVLTDWQMTDMDGLALCRCVRVSQDEGYVYIMMLTVRGSTEDMLAGLAAGADDYIIKGASINEILARLEVGRRIVYAERSLRANQGKRDLFLTDSLTGVHNARYFRKQLQLELARSRRYGRPLAVLSVDIDEAIPIRDRFGHEAGAELLRSFVTRAEGCLRTSSDWLARVGADRFMIVLPETTAYGANRVAQKLRTVFMQEPVTTPAGPVRLEVSIAVTAVEASHKPESTMRMEELVRSADRSLLENFAINAESSDSDAALMSKIGRAGGTHGLN